MKNLNNLDLTRLKNVIVRVDYNVPINSNFIIQDFTRISRSKKTICTILTADCLPILLTDTLGSFVASIHAGWRGMAFGVIENTFKKIGISSKAIVWLGPCISKKNFEVGLDVYDIYIKRDPRTAICFDYKGNGKFNFDLILAAKIKLKNLGVLNVSSINKCTFDDSDNFFSYRRDGNTGRMASLIWIDD